MPPLGHAIDQISLALTASEMQDPILGITENFLADTNEIKMNLGVVRSHVPALCVRI